LYEAMVAQAKTESPLECCGLLAGTRSTDGTALVTARYPLINAAASPVLYESDPRSMLDACRDLDRRGLEILAVYHSHPTSAPIPSKTDRERNFSEDVLNLIITLTTDPPTVRAWWLTADEHREGELVLVDGA
jgi:proteasome lid subunit RPN8/RPN11